MRSGTSLPPGYFERMFAANGDPWDFETSVYEQAKYDVTLAALDRRDYNSGLEIGCANGVLTERLIARCNTLLAIDVSASALARAKVRCGRHASVTLAEMAFPSQRPAGRFDLIVLSEVVYYWSAADIKKTSEFAEAHLERGGDLLLVHWIGETDYPQSGDTAVNLMRDGLPHFKEQRADRYEKYRLDLWRKP